MSRKLALLIIVFINSLFCFKYVERVTEHYSLIAFIYTAFQLVILWLGHKWLRLKVTRSIIYTLILGVPILISILSFLIITPQDLNVDRWSVIDSFLSELFKGNYPYSARSHTGNPPGPMPIYFAIAVPFYTLSCYSFLSLIGFSILGWFKRTLITKEHLVYMLVAILSIPMLWEIMSLSNIITYSTLIVMGLFCFERFVVKKNLMLIVFAILLGLLLSTRSVFALVYLVFFLSYFKSKIFSFSEFFKYSLIIISVFGLTFLPFMLIYTDEFFKMNPFIIQSSFLLPQQFIPVLFVFAMIFGWLARSSVQRFLYSGFTLFFSILFYAVYVVYEFGLNSAVFGSSVDLSYFLFCTPFLLIGLRKEAFQ